MNNLKSFSAWVPVLAGMYLLSLAARTGTFSFMLAAFPAALMIAGSIRSLIFADLRAPQLTAVGALLGVVLALPLGLLGGVFVGLAAFALSLSAFIAGGWFQLKLQPRLDDVPAPKPTLAYSAAVALDDAMLGGVAFMAASNPTLGTLQQSARDSEAAYAFIADNGFLTEPGSFHELPPELESPVLSSKRVHGHDCEYISFDSAFEPRSQLPGRDRWLSYGENYTCHGLILRHNRPGPWLLCVHGFGMGDPGRDFRAFRVGQLHQRTGLNVAMLTLPVHGPRSPDGGFGGKQFFGSSMVDFIHAESQAIWDLRRFIGWIRSQGASQVGVHGISLGAYTSAVLASVEDDLACVIAGVPPTDMIAQREYYTGSFERRLLDTAGVDAQRDRAVYSVVAPLSLKPRVPHNRRFIYAATGDQFVPIEQIHALWRHWEQPRISWCTGGHVSSMNQREPRRLVDEALAESFGAGLRT
jgi:dienelactone hydrolase